MSARVYNFKLTKKSPNDGDVTIERKVGDLANMVDDLHIEDEDIDTKRRIVLAYHIPSKKDTHDIAWFAPNGPRVVNRDDNNECPYDFNKAMNVVRNIKRLYPSSLVTPIDSLDLGEHWRNEPLPPRIVFVTFSWLGPTYIESTGTPDDLKSVMLAQYRWFKRQNTATMKRHPMSQLQFFRIMIVDEKIAETMNFHERHTIISDRPVVDGVDRLVVDGAGIRVNETDIISTRAYFLDRSPHARQRNKIVLGAIMQSRFRDPDPNDPWDLSNEYAAQTLQEIVAMGLMGDKSESKWSDFLVDANNLYDMRLFGAIWEFTRQKALPSPLDRHDDESEQNENEDGESEQNESEDDEWEQYVNDDGEWEQYVNEDQ